MRPVNQPKGRGAGRAGTGRATGRVAGRVPGRATGRVAGRGRNCGVRNGTVAHSRGGRQRAANPVQVPVVGTRTHGATPVRISPDATIREIAARQHGVAARFQLLEGGVERHVIQNRLDRGLFVRVYRGVYRVGVVAAASERQMAAVLACGRAAVLSHRSAAVLWRLLPAGPATEPVHVSAMRRAPAPGPGVRVHRVAVLTADERMVHEQIPVTSPARTIVDLAGGARGGELQEAMAQAERMKLTTRAAIAERLTRYAGRRGMRRLRALVADGRELALLASDLEKRFHRLVRRADLGPVQTNVTLAGWRVDFLWPRHRVVVETDGHAYHAGRDQREKDYRKDNDLRDAGYRVVRFTWRQIAREPEAVIATVARTLAIAGAGLEAQAYDGRSRRGSAGASAEGIERSRGRKGWRCGGAAWPAGQSCSR